MRKEGALGIMKSRLPDPTSIKDKTSVLWEGN